MMTVVATFVSLKCSILQYNQKIKKRKTIGKAYKSLKFKTLNKDGPISQIPVDTCRRSNI